MNEDEAHAEMDFPGFGAKMAEEKNILNLILESIKLQRILDFGKIKPIFIEVK